MPNPMTIPRQMALIAALLTCGAPTLAQQGQQPPPPTVTVVTVKAQDVDLTTTLPGRVAASASAEVRPQVAGIVTERLFQEGERVEAGDVLYKIDPATYAASVAQAKAAVAEAQANVKSTKREADRLQTLSTRNVVSEQALDSAIAARDSAAANLQAAEAQLQMAQIELARTDITARLSGVIGLSMVSPGALVTDSQSQPLAVIRNIDPVYVDVTQSAAELLDFRRGDLDAQRGDMSREVALTLADGSTFGQTGKLTAAEPEVDPLTGVVVLRLEFANPDKLLLPGMYVQVQMPSGQAKDAFLVPQEGVSRDRRGQPIALVVGADGTVEQRVLTVRQNLGQSWVVTDGLKDGDRVVVDGLQKASPGAKVNPHERGEGNTASGGAAPAEGDAATPSDTPEKPSE